MFLDQHQMHLVYLNLLFIFQLWSQLSNHLLDLLRFFELYLMLLNHVNLNENLMVESLTQIKSGITINVDASAKNITQVKKIIFGIMLYVVTKLIII